MIDHGANGGLTGTDCRIIAKCPDRFINIIEGIDHHQLLHVPIVTCGAYTLSRNDGPVIVVFHQFAGMQQGLTIISSVQLESCFNVVNDRSDCLDPSGQLITTNDGFEFPLHFCQGLPYLDMRPYTDQVLDTLLPHVVMTSDVDWDPATMDGEFPLSCQETDLDLRFYDNGTDLMLLGTTRIALWLHPPGNTTISLSPFSIQNLFQTLSILWKQLTAYPSTFSIQHLPMPRPPLSTCCHI